MIPDLWPDYVRFCEFLRRSSGSGVGDLGHMEWIYPTTLLPIGTFLISNRASLKLPEDSDVANYISIMLDPTRMASRADRSYVPLIRLPPKSEEEDRVLGIIYRLHDQGSMYGGENAFKYLIGELADNVYQHSRFSNAFVMAQRYEKKEFVEVAIIDDGITIGGSLRRAGRQVGDDTDAIDRVLKEGVSAKGADTRGFGIRTNAMMATTGLGGTMLIVSGAGAVEVRGSEPRGEVRQNNYRLERDFYPLRGTLVSVRIPFPSKEIDLYDFTS